MIYTWVGEKDLAIKQLEKGLTNSQLGLLWRIAIAPLRGDPHFERLVEEVKKPLALE